MKFSESWLREWVNPQIDRSALLEQLTMAGLEVEGVTPVAGEFDGVVVGRVDEVEAHPDADKLSVCRVFDGQQTLQVVCGAPNVRAGLVTAFARVGAVLPEGFKIKQAKLRGIVSSGMLCSAAELGLGEDADGIIELPTTLAPGADLREQLALDDVSIEVDLTPNRGDCLSLKGIAREVGVLNDAPVQIQPITAVTPVHDAIVPVRLEHPAGCPRYLGRVIRDVDLSQPSPRWLTERLRRAGVRAIDAVVDITNYVMIELGQPMHAFDLAQIGDEVIVRLARPDETLELLDGKQVMLDGDTLLIADVDGPIAMAGVMGGSRSGIGPNTRDVFLECAFFAPLAIAGTARRYGLHTEASHRYERGVDYALQADAMERATQLLLEIVGGTPGPVFEAADPAHLPQPAQATLRERRLNAVLGTDIAVDEVERALTRLDFELLQRIDKPTDGVCWTIRAPTHRFDIALEADLIEEICRVHGYNRIPSKRPVTTLKLREVAFAQSSEQALKQLLSNVGYQEVITYSFIDPKLLDVVSPDATPLTLQNPMSQEQSVMRTTLLPGLIEVWRSNQARQTDRLRIFELGLCFLPGDGQLQQIRQLGGLLTGASTQESWHGAPQVVDFFELKGDVERLLRWRGAGAVRFSPRGGDPALHPGQGADLLIDDVWIGRLGRLHPEVESALQLGQAVYAFELEVDALLKRPPRRYHQISKFPAVRRDLALLVNDEVAAADVEATVRDVLSKVLVEFRLFDVYHGKGIDSTKKSLAMGLTLQHASATLTDEEIAAYIDQVVKALSERFGAEQR